MTTNEKASHLGFIQQVINRMGQNSFLIKGWTITLITAILAMNIEIKNVHFLYFATIIIVISWLLDSYYLYLEKSYRLLYDDIINDKEIIPFSMDISEYKNRTIFSKSLFSRTTLPLYGMITLSNIFLILQKHNITYENITFIARIIGIILCGTGSIILAIRAKTILKRITESLVAHDDAIKKIVKNNSSKEDPFLLNNTSHLIKWEDTTGLWILVIGFSLLGIGHFLTLLNLLLE